ncbi:MAG: pyridoxamine 5'-phosphate oxidase family protein [Planctomycetota bacterium]
MNSSSTGSDDPTESFAKTNRNQVRRSPKRATYDKQVVYGILDATALCLVSFVHDSKPFSIPMMFARQDNSLLFHGSNSSRLMQVLCGGQDLCISVTLVDGLVIAKSLFHSSMNYRSVTVFGRGREILGNEPRLDALKQMSDKVLPGRWEDARFPTPQEMKATLLAAVKIEDASAKIRTGEPVDATQDLELPYWSGVIPLRVTAEAPEPDASSSSMQLPVPTYVNRRVREMSKQ